MLQNPTVDPDAANVGRICYVRQPLLLQETDTSAASRRPPPLLLIPSVAIATKDVRGCCNEQPTVLQSAGRVAARATGGASGGARSVAGAASEVPCCCKRRSPELRMEDGDATCSYWRCCDELQAPPLELQGEAAEVQAVGAAKDERSCCKLATMMLPTSSPATLLQRGPRRRPHGGTVPRPLVRVAGRWCGRVGGGGRR